MSLTDDLDAVQGESKILEMIPLYKGPDHMSHRSFLKQTDPLCEAYVKMTTSTDKSRKTGGSSSQHAHDMNEPRANAKGAIPENDGGR